MEALKNAYEILYIAVLCSLAVFMLFAMIRAIKGARIVDRIIGINMICTLTTIAIAVLAMLLGEKYLLDVCIIYVTLGCLAVLTLCRIYITVYLKRKNEKERREKEANSHDA